MDRQSRAFWSIVLSSAIFASGCTPTQPFYAFEDGDLSHYLDVATEISYPDVAEPQLDEVTGALPPLTLRNMDDYEMWDLTLEEATRITLCNSQVMRQLGANVQENAPETLSRNLINSAAVTTTYDPALVETSTGTSVGSQFSGTGVESALAEFDAQLDASTQWVSQDRPSNFDTEAIAGLQPNVFVNDVVSTNVGVSKTAATGGQFALNHNIIYDYDPQTPTRIAPSQWEANFEAFFSQPLLQGAGTQYNRIAGPNTFDAFAQGGVNAIDGVMIARIRTDQTLADFEGGVRNLIRDCEFAYWQLYFAYRDLEARKVGRDSALETWKSVAARFRAGASGGSAGPEAQARAQYFQFKALVEEGLSALYAAETRLRYVMGLAVSDGRLIRPAEEPTTALVEFDWSMIHSEALVRRVEIRRQKWEIKRRELELIAARNHLLPRLDVFGTYRWVGLGDNLFEDGADAGAVPFAEGTGAFDALTDGNFQEAEMGLRFSLPIGFRREMAGVRHHQLLLARDRALLQDLELEVSHQLGDAIRDLDTNYTVTETNFNRRVAAEREVEAVQAQYDAGRVSIDLLLDAQRRRSDAETAYYQSLVNYAQAIVDVHFRKGSLLDYNAVYLAEAPWPGKAYFDAMREARKRDASMYLDYGFTRPAVISRGAVEQRAMGGVPAETVIGEPTPVIEGDAYYDRGAAVELPASPEGVSGEVAAAAPVGGGVASSDFTTGVADEHQASHAAFETPADAPIGGWAGR